MLRFITIAALALAATTQAVSIAEAQPGQSYAQPPPPAPLPPPYVAPPPVRRGLTLGFDLGVGSMEADSGPIRCDGCEDDEPAAGSLGFWIGAMLNPRFALLFHGSITGRALDDAGDLTLINSTALVAGKWWLSRRFWIKGGLGYASLTISTPTGDDRVAEGGAGMLGLGFEAVHAPKFALDIGLTVTSSTYDEIDDTIGTGILGVGLNWF